MSGHLLSKTRGAPPQGDRYEAALPVLSPDGQRAVAIKANQALISRVANGAVLAILQGHREDLTEASFSPDGRWVLTASNDATARVWNASTGKLIAILQGNAGRVPQIRREYAGESHKPDAVTHATFSPDGLGVITARADGTVQIWALAIGQAVGTLERFEAATNGLALSPDGSRIIGYRSKKVLLWNSVDLRQELTLQHPENVENVCFSPDGHWLLTSAEQLRLWNSQTGTLRAVLPASRGSTRARFSHDGRQIITFGAGNDAAVRDSKDGKIRVSLVHQVPINDATFSPDDRLIATSGRDGVARVWNAATGKIRLNLKDETDDNVTEFGVYAATFSPDGKRLAVAGEWNWVRVWDSHTGKLAFRLNTDGRWVWRAIYSPDGRRILTDIKDDTEMHVTLWTADGKKLNSVRGNTPGEVQGTFSPDSGWFLAGGDVLRVWRITNGQLIATFQAPTSVNAAFDTEALFLPDGQRIVTLDGKVWRIVTLRELDAILQ